MGDVNQLKDAIKIHSALEKYQEDLYLRFVRQFNENADDILKENLGNEFVKNCGHDLAGEVVRNFFNLSEFYISVDQMAKRMLIFSYEEDYDPLSENGKEDNLRKRVFSNNEIISSRVDEITKKIEESQKKLFTEERSKDKLDREKKAWRETQKYENGDLYDDLTGEKGETSTRSKNGKEYETSRLQADHIQSREAAMYTDVYANEERADRLKEYYNSDANFQLMLDSANSSKGDVRVCIVNGEIKNYNTKDADYKTLVEEHPECDITYKATPEQMADAICEMWEKKTTSGKKNEELKKHGYLDENGKVTKSVRKELIRNIRHSQNEESKVILQTTDYKEVSKDSGIYVVSSLWKVVAGQIIYYAAPPLIYEIKVICKDKNLTLDNALEKITGAGKRIGNYILRHLKSIFSNILENSLKNFVKSFMDILINMVKATVKRLLKIAKSLVLSTVDAVRIITDKNSDSTQKADAVFNLFSITVTSCVVDVIFEIINAQCHLPEWLFAPLQILATVVCTNLTMLVLKKLDLFDVQYGYKIANLRKLFENSREEYNRRLELAEEYAYDKINVIIEEAKRDCRLIYDNLQGIDVKETSARPMLERINSMFNMEIDFENEWQAFLGNALIS